MTTMAYSAPFPHRHRDTSTTSPEARQAVDARIRNLEATLGSLRAAEELVVRPIDLTTDEEVSEIVARLRNLEAVLALEDLDP